MAKMYEIASSVPVGLSDSEGMGMRRTSRGMKRGALGKSLLLCALMGAVVGSQSALSEDEDRRGFSNTCRDVVKGLQVDKFTNPFASKRDFDEAFDGVLSMIGLLSADNQQRLSVLSPLDREAWTRALYECRAALGAAMTNGRR
jgi:hypothetical protein